MSSIALILLAAGGSVRMGSPKQLLLYRGQTLLRRAAEQAVAAGCSPVVVVVGSHAQQMKTELTGLDVCVLENPDWNRGIGTSIRAGVAELPADCPAVILALCDQPMIDAAALQQLIDAHQSSDRPIVAAQYAGTVGVPALFSRRFIPLLAQLPDESGAKQILLAHAGEVLPIPMESAAIDIDKPQDYQDLL